MGEQGEDAIGTHTHTKRERERARKRLTAVRFGSLANTTMTPLIFERKPLWDREVVV